MLRQLRNLQTLRNSVRKGFGGGGGPKPARKIQKVSKFEQDLEFFGEEYMINNHCELLKSTPTREIIFGERKSGSGNYLQNLMDQGVKKVICLIKLYIMINNLKIISNKIKNQNF